MAFPTSSLSVIAIEPSGQCNFNVTQWDIKHKKNIIEHTKCSKFYNDLVLTYETSVMDGKTIFENKRKNYRWITSVLSNIWNRKRTSWISLLPGYCFLLKCFGCRGSLFHLSLIGIKVRYFDGNECLTVWILKLLIFAINFSPLRPFPVSTVDFVVLIYFPIW